MWIRSQGKKMLVEVKRIEVARYLDEGYRILNQHNYIDGMDDFDILGEYESEERAIEVLDEIQENINVLEYDKVYKSYHEKMYAQGRYVYKMPKE